MFSFKCARKYSAFSKHYSEFWNLFPPHKHNIIIDTSTKNTRNKIPFMRHIKLLHISTQGVTFRHFYTTATQDRPVPHRPFRQSTYPFGSQTARHTIYTATTINLERINITATLCSILCIFKILNSSMRAM